MGKFHHFADKVNRIAAAAFEEYRKTEEEYQRAEAQAKLYPPRGGIIDAEYQAKAARAQADVLTARQAFSAAGRKMAAHSMEIAALRKELAAEIEDAYSVDPEQLDNATLELLKSGILTASEYEKLYRKATAADNVTTVRLIAKYAQDAADARGKEYGINDPEARELRAVVYDCNTFTGAESLADFDVMADVFNRCANNPGMISHWEELTAEVSESL